MASAAKAKKTVRIASGRKRVRQDIRLNAANSAMRSKFRTAVKSVLKAVQGARRLISGSQVK
jgi:small subunit ribosomal protein S20